MNAGCRTRIFHFSKNTKQQAGTSWLFLGFVLWGRMCRERGTSVFSSYPATRALASLSASYSCPPPTPRRLMLLMLHMDVHRRTVHQSALARIRILAKGQGAEDYEVHAAQERRLHLNSRPVLQPAPGVFRPPSTRYLSSLHTAPGLDAVIEENKPQAPPPCLRAGGRRTSAPEHHGRTATGIRRPAAAAAAAPALLTAGQALISLAPAAPSMLGFTRPLHKKRPSLFHTREGLNRFFWRCACHE